MTLVLVALAGGLGAAARYGVDLALSSPTTSRLPHATLAVNLTGSLLIGLLVGASAGADTLTVLGTGLLGGYTTFSSASVEVARRILSGRRIDGMLTAIAMMVGCVGLASVGVFLGHLV
ncbi:MAG: CrcB family protein [Aeromicrobium sp.]